MIAASPDKGSPRLRLGVAALIAIAVHLAFFELLTVPPYPNEGKLGKQGRLVRIDPEQDPEARRLVDSLLTQRPQLPDLEMPAGVDPLSLSDSGAVLRGLRDHEVRLLSVPELKLEIELPSVVQAGAPSLPPVATGMQSDFNPNFAEVKAIPKLTLSEGIRMKQKFPWVPNESAELAGQLWVAQVAVAPSGKLEMLTWMEKGGDAGLVAEFEQWLRSQKFIVEGAKTTHWGILSIEWEAADD